ncbi:MAG: hypothetical protein C4527_26585 [Candidatus Omnitrophota bacterium]|jgi:fructokinase|nr:MAG: hypothetical protein C4527_26585 [Candidatus Omnitrophota bacterium]
MNKEIISPTAVGTGLICLDAIEIPADSHYKLFTGGTCINVLVILQSYGWNIVPIGRIGDDPAAESIFRDLEFLGVDTRFIRRDRNDFTPIYIETFSTEGHRFLHRCPRCQTKFADFQPVAMADILFILPELPDKIDVCFIDRVSQASLTLAEYCKEHGALIYFEPNRPEDISLFEQCLQITNVVKYSAEKMASAKEMTDRLHIPLEIETHGKKGLYYRTDDGRRKSEWRHMPAIPCHAFVDAAGSGDWLSSHLIHQLMGDTNNQRNTVCFDAIEFILRTAQKIASSNCGQEGARGSMYHTADIQIGAGFCPYCGY